MGPLLLPPVCNADVMLPCYPRPGMASTPDGVIAGAVFVKQAGHNSEYLTVRCARAHSGAKAVYARVAHTRSSAPLP